MNAAFPVLQPYAIMAWRGKICNFVHTEENWSSCIRFSYNVEDTCTRIQQDENLFKPFMSIAGADSKRHPFRSFEDETCRKAGQTRYSPACSLRGLASWGKEWILNNAMTAACRRSA